jgi:hypothetical protein
VKGSKTDRTPEQWFEHWKASLEVLWRESGTLFWSRKLHRNITKMFMLNPQLHDNGGPALGDWIDELYAAHTIIAVRRILDDQNGATTLVNLLRELEKNAHLLTREWYSKVHPEPETAPEEWRHAPFERCGGPHGPGKPEDTIAAAKIKAHREDLKRVAVTTIAYANRVVAHRQSTEASVLREHVDNALIAIYRTLRHYNGLLLGIDRVTATATPTFDWLGPFRVPWIDGEFQPVDDGNWDPL